MNAKTEEEKAKRIGDLRKKYGDAVLIQVLEALERLVKDGEALRERQRKRDEKRLAEGYVPKVRVRKKKDPAIG